MKIPTVSMISIAGVVLCCTTSSCKEPVLRHAINQGDTCFSIKNNNTTHAGGFGLNIVENSANDTILILSRKIAPGFTGEVFRATEQYFENDRVCIQSLNATSGTIGITIHY